MPPEAQNGRPGLRLITGNRMELLVDRLASSVADRNGDPFAKELVIVPNPGMARWLSMQLADRFGIWANAEFLFPDAFVRRLFAAFAPELPERSFFDPDALTWSILSLLGQEDVGAPQFAPLRGYLRDGRMLKRYQLAARIADTFDQYTIYRPETILSWDRGDDDHWQALLWRRLIARAGEPHRARLQHDFLRSVASIGSVALPRRLSVFGMSSLPPFHTAVLAALGTRIPVCLYVLNPSAEYWDQIVSDREAARIVRRSLRSGGSGGSGGDLHLEAGNPLLASFGHHGRDFFALLHDLDIEDEPAAADDFPNTLLGQVQADIFHLVDRGAAGGETRLPITSDDRSIEVHSCYSPQREVEALHDWLLSRFDGDPTLSPSDILVMTPDLETYAPFIRAVFDTPDSPELRIPSSLADLKSRSESAVVNAFLAILRLPLSRFEAAEVMDLLETPCIRNALGIGEEDLPRLRSWVRESGIRWGADSSTLGRLDLPVGDGNTWEAGCDRLLLGYALPSCETRTFAANAGLDALEGADAAIAGSLLDFIGQLSDFAVWCVSPRSPAGWGSLLAGVLDSFFAPDADSAEALGMIREAITSLCAAEGRIGGLELDHETVIEYLKSRLDRGGSETPFLSGGVTFCAMMPMRSIPFKVICCIGMNDGAFPRKRFRQSWDLIAAHPKRGDRSLDREERYLFLETLLSCRERLYISHIGRSLRDNAKIGPSVVVEELLAVIDRSFFLASGSGADGSEKPVSSIVQVEHRLQGWNPAYFAGGRLFTYARYGNGSAGFDRPGPFFKLPLSEISGELLTPDLGRFIGFFRNPARELLTGRLGMTFEKQEEQLDDNEPFGLAGLDRHGIGRELAERYLDGESDESCFAYLKARGTLPHGSAGRLDFDRLSGEVRNFIAGPKRCLDRAEALPPLAFRAAIGPVEITGSIGDCSKTHRLAFGFSAPSPGDCIEAWIIHLLLNAFGGALYPRVTLLFGTSRTFRLEPVADPKTELSRLAVLYADGMRAPLPFFPKSSHAFAEAVLLKGREPSAAAGCAFGIWQGNEFSAAPGEKENPYFAFCFGSDPQWADPGSESCRIALELWKPFFACVKEIEG